MTPSIPHKSFRMPAEGKWLLDKSRPTYTPSHKTDITVLFNRVRREMKVQLKVAA